MLQLHHDNLIAGHFGTCRTLELVARRYNWPGMLQDLKAYTIACSMCQGISPVQQSLHSMMELLPLPRGSRTDISMNFIVGLPESFQRPRGRLYNAILVVVDCYTKLTQYSKCRNTIDAAGLVKIIGQKLALRGT